MYQSNINDAKANLSQLIRHALAGDEVIIARNNEPLVRLMPIEQDISPRLGGFWSGKVHFIGDIDEVDREIEKLFLGSHVEPSEAQ